jgi:twinkle protein
MSNVIDRVQCPKCLDKSGDNLVRYDDGHNYCYACGHVEFTRKGQVDLSTPFLEATNLDPCLYLSNVSKETIRKYGVKVVVDDYDKVHVDFQLHDSNLKPANHHLREVNLKTGKLTRTMVFAPRGKVKLPIFGLPVITKKTTTIVVTEGETDCLRLASRIANPTVAVIALVGSVNAEKVAAYLIGRHSDKRLVTAFDNDDAGLKATESFHDYVKQHDKQAWVLKFPSSFNDVSDWLESISGSDLDVEYLIEKPKLSGILTANELSDRLNSYLDKLGTVENFQFNFSPTLSKAVSFLPGKLIAIAGSSGEGKSTLTEHFIMEILQQKHKVLLCSQEMLPEEVSIKLLRMVLNKPLHDPEYVSQLEPAERQLITDRLRGIASYLFVSDGFGALSIDQIDNYIHELTSRGDKPYAVFIDHLLAITSNTENSTLMDACKSLKEMARRHSVVVVVLTHVRKLPGNSRDIKKINLDDFYGSIALAVYSDSGMGIASDKDKNEAYVDVIKVDRMNGKKVSVTLCYSDYVYTEYEHDSTLLRNTYGNGIRKGQETEDYEEDIY